MTTCEVSSPTWMLWAWPFTGYMSNIFEQECFPDQNKLTKQYCEKEIEKDWTYLCNLSRVFCFFVKQKPTPLIPAKNTFYTVGPNHKVPSVWWSARTCWGCRVQHWNEEDFLHTWARNKICKSVINRLGINTWGLKSQWILLFIYYWENVNEWIMQAEWFDDVLWQKWRNGPLL